MKIIRVTDDKKKAKRFPSSVLVQDTTSAGCHDCGNCWGKNNNY